MTVTALNIVRKKQKLNKLLIHTTRHAITIPTNATNPTTTHIILNKFRSVHRNLCGFNEVKKFFNFILRILLITATPQYTQPHPSHLLTSPPTNRTTASHLSCFSAELFSFKSDREWIEAKQWSSSFSS